MGADQRWTEQRRRGRICPRFTGIQAGPPGTAVNFLSFRAAARIFGPRVDPRPKHYCGVFGVYGQPQAAQISYYGLYALQHRGQESAGIVSFDEEKEVFHVHKGMGLVPAIFDMPLLDKMTGASAIGHTRYSTAGASTLGNAQPLTVDCVKGKIAIAHNGNLTNAAELREELEAQGSIFQTTVDSEIILHLLAQPKRQGGHESALVDAMHRIQGAYSLVMLTEKELIGVRDPHGFRPLSLGRLESGAYVLASETCAFDLTKATFIRDLEPGEIVIIDKAGIRSIQAFPDQKRRAFCVFEYVYFARPDSTIDGRNVYKVRVEMGRQLARENQIDADIVIPVPDSGVCAALGYSMESGIPFEMAFVRNHYVGRSFLQPSQFVREFAVRVKLNLIADLVRGKRVIIIDDSIVRGTTSKMRVTSLKEAGAKEVHFLVSCPPHVNPCVYGIDFPERDKLMAATHTLEGIRQFLNADSLSYLTQDGMVKATGHPKEHFCLACFNGDYPVKFESSMEKHLLERRRTRASGLGPEIAVEARQQRLL